MQEKERYFLLFALSIACQIYSLVGKHLGIYAIDKTMAVWIWFVMGMLLAEKIIRPIMN